MTTVFIVSKSLNLKKRLKSSRRAIKKEQKRLEREMKKTQKRNREDKVSLYENIYTVAGYCLATQQDLGVYIKNAEEVIAHFKVSSEVRAVAVEAFNRALDRSFDFDSFVNSYKTNIGKNRDYMKYVLTYAYLIASVDGEMNYEVKDRLVNIATALESTKVALKRLFQSKVLKQDLLKSLMMRKISQAIIMRTLMKRVTLVMIMAIRANHLTTILQIVTLIGAIQITQIAEDHLTHQLQVIK